MFADNECVYSDVTTFNIVLTRKTVLRNIIRRRLRRSASKNGQNQYAYGAASHTFTFFIFDTKGTILNN